MTKLFHLHRIFKHGCREGAQGNPLNSFWIRHCNHPVRPPALLLSVSEKLYNSKTTGISGYFLKQINTDKIWVSDIGLAKILYLRLCQGTGGSRRSSVGSLEAPPPPAPSVFHLLAPGLPYLYETPVPTYGVSLKVSI